MSAQLPLRGTEMRVRKIAYVVARCAISIRACIDLYTDHTREGGACAILSFDVWSLL